MGFLGGLGGPKVGEPAERVGVVVESEGEATGEAVDEGMRVEKKVKRRKRAERDGGSVYIAL